MQLIGLPKTSDAMPKEETVHGPLDFELLAKVLEILQPIKNHNFTRGRPENRDPIIA